MPQFGAVRFPILPVEECHVDLFDGAGIEAARVDAIAVGIGPRDVKRFDAAYPAKQMLGHAGVEAVSRQVFFASI